MPWVFTGDGAGGRHKRAGLRRASFPGRGAWLLRQAVAQFMHSFWKASIGPGNERVEGLDQGALGQGGPQPARSGLRPEK